MGDRTYVNLHLPKACAEQAKQIMGSSLCVSDEEDLDGADSDLAWFGFEEVNYGELPFLKQLQAAGIAYTSSWASGDEYTAGSEFCRFTADGEAKVLTVYDEDLGVPLEELQAVLDDHAKLKAVILAHQAKTVPLPWTHQVEYGQRYRARQLIEPAG